MSFQFTAIPTSKKISDLNRRIKEGSLILQPEFQRKFVWNTAHRESFIETILKGLPFPEIYVAQRGVDLDTLSSQEVVVDGQQRLSTIVRYIDEAEDSKMFKNVPKFRELSEQDQRDFLNYTVVVRDLGDIEVENIKEIFRRINLTKYNLKQIEIHNAVYDGEYISLAKELSEISELGSFPAFNEAGLLRMGDVDFALLVVTTVEDGGYFAYSNEVEKYISKYNDEYPNKEKITSQFTRTARIIKSLKLEVDSLWYRKSNFFTLFVELMGINEVPNNLKVKLEEFERNLLENKSKENEYGQYYAAMFTGTNKRKERVTRSDMFKKYILGLK